MPQDPLNLLCLEPRFPGRLGATADWLVRKRGYRCWFYCNQIGPAATLPASVGNGLEVVRYDVGGVAREASVHWTRQLERGLCHAYGAWEALETRRPRPIDVVLGRTAGLGSTLFAPVFAPGAPIVNLFDYYLDPHRNDLAEDLGPTMPPDYFHWRRAANAMDLLDLENAPRPWAPTAWQRELYPAEYRSDFRVLFDGIDGRSRSRQPRDNRYIGSRTIGPDTFLLTFVSTDLDRLRGFDRFASLAADLMREKVDVLAVAVGSPVVRRPYDIPNFGRDYAAMAVAGMPDPSRLVILGESDASLVGEVLGASDLHCYPSRPYPVGRSLVEAMATGVPILAWDHEPVREFLTHEVDALLCRPDDPRDALALALRAARDPASVELLGRAAAKKARSRFDRDETLPALAGWLDELAKGGGRV